MAAGLSIPEENADIFRQRINELATLTEAELTPKVRIDVPMPLDYVTLDLVREFTVLAPFGKGNLKPIFADKGVRINRIMIMGKNRNVVKLGMVSTKGTPATGIYFGDVEAFLSYIENKFGKEQLEAAMNGMSNQIQLSLVYFPKINSFRGADELQFEIQFFQ